MHWARGSAPQTVSHLHHCSVTREQSNQTADPAVSKHDILSASASST